MRKADIDASAGSVQVLERLVKIIRHKWPLVKILLRGDSGFCREALMRWCETHGVKYLLGLAKNKRLLKRLTGPIKKAKRDWACSGRASRRFIQFSYRTRSSWTRSRRVVGKAEYMDKGENPRFVVQSALRNTRGKNSTKRSTARAAKWRIESRNSNCICLLTEQVRPRCVQIKYACGSPLWPT